MILIVTRLYKPDPNPIREFRLSLLKGGAKNKPLSATERAQTIESLQNWIDHIGILSSKVIMLVQTN
jgi:hypothetical protein